MRRTLLLSLATIAGNSAPLAASDLPESGLTFDLNPVPVWQSLIANDRPAGTLALPVSVLRFEPRVDLQSRGVAEMQSDVVIRGGVFENTGFSIGAVPIFDPQTGHYAAELPLDPAMLSRPAVLVGLDNARSGFNANVGTVSYGWAPVVPGGRAEIGFGGNALSYQRLMAGAEISSNWSADVSISHAEGDGSIENGDHEFNRVAVRFQRHAGRQATNIAYGFIDKFVGWPGMYTGNAALPETDDYQAHLLVIEHRMDYGDSSYLALGTSFRQLDDDYEFRRTTPNKFFEHLTRSYTGGLEGRHSLTDDAFLSYRLIAVADDLVRSTSLAPGPGNPRGLFGSRMYGKGAAVYTQRFADGSGNEWEIEGGLSGDVSNRHTSLINPMAGLAYIQRGLTITRELRFELSQSSQVPSYTTLNSAPSGLFGGNASLGRERSQTFEASFAASAEDWDAGANLFVRLDDDLADWTYNSASSSARQANPVDITTYGLELVLVRRFAEGAVSFGYTYLEKEEDYGSGTVDASYYALNFPKHRAVLSAEWRPAPEWVLLADAEWRQERENPLRTSGDEALFVSVGVAWTPEVLEGLELGVIGDNVLDESHQEFPGTPGAGRELAAYATYRW